MSSARARRAAQNEVVMLKELLEHQQRVSQAGLITAALAHDVDNHAQVLTGATFLALRSDDPAEWRRALEIVQERCFAMTEVTRSFLGFLRRKDVHGVGAFGLMRAVKEARQLVELLAKQEDVTLSVVVDDDANLMGEHRVLVQALVNLLSNAVKAVAGRNEGAVVLEVTLLETEARVVVSDNGPGIPDEIRSRIFRPMATTDGHGIGLFIVRQNIRRLGGSIRVESSDAGTTFELRLPLLDH